MSDADLDIDGIDAAARLISQDLTAVLDAAILALSLEVQGRIAPYPSARRQKQPFTSAKQRRGFFAKLRKGQIKVPYQRTGQLGQKWVAERGSGQIRVRNMRRGAKYVHSESEQSKYHAGNWKTDKGVADQVTSDGTAARVVEQALKHTFGDG